MGICISADQRVWYVEKLCQEGCELVMLASSVCCVVDAVRCCMHMYVIVTNLDEVSGIFID